jgi:hypothetical protein
MFYGASFFQFPLWIGSNERHLFDLFRDLTAIKDGTASLRELDFDSHLDGLPVCKVSLAYETATCTYWIDLNRGCVPLRILNHYNQSNTETTVSYGDLEQVPDAGWLPRRSLDFIGNGTTVHRMVVTEVDVRNKPPSSVFQLEFPEPVRLVDGAKMLVYTRGKTWSLLKLPSANSPGTKALAKSFSAFPPDLPGEIEPGLPWAAILPTIALLFLILVSIVVLKRRRRTPTRV